MGLLVDAAAGDHPSAAAALAADPPASSAPLKDLVATNMLKLERRRALRRRRPGETRQAEKRGVSARAVTGFGAGSSDVEVRIDWDKNMYTEAEFLKHYGQKKGPGRWKAAVGETRRAEERGVSVRAVTGFGAGSSDVEVRIDWDKNMYTEAEFLEHYGQKKGPGRWKAAVVIRPSPTAENTELLNWRVQEAFREVDEFPGYRLNDVRWRYCQWTHLYYCLQLRPDGSLWTRNEPPLGEAFEETF